MKRHGWSWYVFGAQAVVAYGRPRMTGDVDATVALGQGSPRQLVDALTAAGFVLRVPDAESFVAVTRVFPFLHEASGMPLDLVLAGPGLEESFLERARVLDLGGVKAPVISPEDLVITKIIAGRPKDREDIVGVLHEQGEKLDFAYVRSMLRLTEAALDQSDLSPMFEGLLATARPKKPQGPRAKKK